MKTKQIYLIRHGLSDYNLDPANIPYGQNVQLTSDGKQQAIKSGLYLKKFRIQEKNFDCVYSSPLLRTRETAVIMADQIGYDSHRIVFLNDLQEQKHGMLGIKSKNTMKADPEFNALNSLVKTAAAANRSYRKK